jgi:hypothetical protein
MRAGRHEQILERRRMDDVPELATVVGDRVEGALLDGPRIEVREAAIGLRIEIDEERLAPRIDSAAARLTAVVVLPTPPF